MRRSGFTLAEVLITLVIIGVIAAMTIPTLMNNTNSQEYRTGIKKAISMLNQAITMQYALDGTQISDFKNSATAVRDTVFAKRLNVISTANATNFYGGGHPSTIFYTADGMKFGIETAYNGGTDCDANGDNACYYLWIDVNGDKKPNSLTAATTKPQDIYAAKIYSQRVVPEGAVTQGVIFEQ